MSITSETLLDTGHRAGTEKQKMVAQINGLNTRSYSTVPPVGFQTPSQLSGIVVSMNGRTAECNITPYDFIDISSFPNRQYVDWERPDSSGDGTSWATAERVIGIAIDNAISSAVDTVIYVRGGEYNKDSGITQSNAVKTLNINIAIIAVEGRVRTGTFATLTWSKTGGQTNVYQATRSLGITAWNPSVTGTAGEYSQYTLVGSIAACDSTPNSWYTDNITVYVHHNLSQPVTNQNCRVYIQQLGAAFTGNFNLFMRGIDMEGGRTGAYNIAGGSTNNVVLDDCTGRYAAGGTAASPTLQNGLTQGGCGLSFARSCDMSYNTADGFNYHQSGGIDPNVLVVSCKGHHNGTVVSGGVSNNGFTTHENIVSIDVGGDWRYNFGTGSGHVNDTQMWAVGSTAGDSVGDEREGGSINWGAFAGWSGDPKLWLDKCEDVGSEWGTFADPSATLLIRGHIGIGRRSAGVEEY